MYLSNDNKNGAEAIADRLKAEFRVEAQPVPPRHGRSAGSPAADGTRADAVTRADVCSTSAQPAQFNTNGLPSPRCEGSPFKQACNSISGLSWDSWGLGQPRGSSAVRPVPYPAAKNWGCCRSRARGAAARLGPFPLPWIDLASFRGWGWPPAPRLTTSRTFRNLRLSPLRCHPRPNRRSSLQNCHLRPHPRRTAQSLAQTTPRPDKDRKVSLSSSVACCLRNCFDRRPQRNKGHAAAHVRASTRHA